MDIASFGFCILFLGIIVAFILGNFLKLSLLTLIPPFMIMSFSVGLFFANILGTCLTMFPQKAGIASAVQACTLMIIGSAGIFIISHFTFNSLNAVALIFASVAVIQLISFIAFRKLS